MKEFLDDPVVFFQNLGGLHDAEMEYIKWNVLTKVVMIEVLDLNANFEGLPEYSGTKRATVEFFNVENLAMSFDGSPEDVQRIYRLKVLKKSDDGKFEVTLNFVPSGRLSIDCDSVVVNSGAGD
jgi:hypothetical protein